MSAYPGWPRHVRGEWARICSDAGVGAAGKIASYSMFTPPGRVDPSDRPVPANTNEFALETTRSVFTGLHAYIGPSTADSGWFSGAWRQFTVTSALFTP